ncbi:methyltransferase, TIGR04325 family [Desulforhopalus sp. 52FAK]
MNATIKRKILAGLELLPFGRDIYLQMAKNRLGISYRGIYDSYNDAKKALPTNKPGFYDVINKNKATNIETEKQGLDVRFQDMDYPVLYWLTKLMKKNSIVLELGGNIGHFFYTFETFSLYPSGVQWIIAELREAVLLGRKIAEERNEQRLTFVESDKMYNLGVSEILLTSGTLQYMDISLPQLLNEFQTLPPHVIVHNLPSHKDMSYWTLQNLEVCEVPYRIYSQEELLREMKNLGYGLEAQWKYDRKVEVPYHLDMQVEGYLGYYFRLVSSQKQ